MKETREFGTEEKFRKRSKPVKGPRTARNRSKRLERNKEEKLRTWYAPPEHPETGANPRKDRTEGHSEGNLRKLSKP